MLQGEREMAADNKLLGQFDLVGIPPAQRGQPQIEVTFDIDANGIVNVTARDKATGKEQQITIQSSGGLSDSEVERMVRDAEQNAERDRKRKELIEVQNQADSLIYSTEKSIREHKDKVPADVISTIEKDIENVRKLRESAEDAQTLQTALDQLQQSSMKVNMLTYHQPCILLVHVTIFIDANFMLYTYIIVIHVISRFVHGVFGCDLTSSFIYSLFRSVKLSTKVHHHHPPPPPTLIPQNPMIKQ